MAPTTHLSAAEAGAQITRDNLHWGDALGAAAGPISYGFRQGPPSYNSSSNERGSFSQVSGAEKAVVETAMRLWSNLANITFAEVNPNGYTNAAAILIGNYHNAGDGAEAFAYYPFNDQSPTSAQGDVWLNVADRALLQPRAGSYQYLTIEHEIGHALGLQHPGDYDAEPGVSITYDASAQYVEDSRQHSIMSYFGASNTGATHVYQGQAVFASTPLLHDIAAIQRLYGANTSFASGNTAYGFNSNADPAYHIGGATQQVVYSIWDGGGVDTLDFSGYRNNQTIDLTPGNFSSIGALTKNVSIAIGVTIENSIGGAGDDFLIGNNVENSLVGGGGNDRLQGGFRNDVIDGGTGTNTALYTEPSKNYTVSVEFGGSTVTVQDKVGLDGVDTLYNVQKAQFVDQSLDTSWLLKTATLPRAQLLELTDLYIASFDRAPDALGLMYWGSRLKDGMSIADIAESFFMQPEMVATYAPGQSDRDFFATVYENVLGRTPDDAGLAYWTGELGADRISRDVSLLSVLSGAQGMSDAGYLSNKEAVGIHFALEQGLNNVNWARTVMEGVDDTMNSVAFGEALADVFASQASMANTSELVVRILGIEG